MKHENRIYKNRKIPKQSVARHQLLNTYLMIERPREIEKRALSGHQLYKAMINEI